jgi:hypothetical protein
MAKRTKKASSEKKVIEFVLDDLEPVSSAEILKTTPAEQQKTKKAVGEVGVESDPGPQKELEPPKEPVIENRSKVKSDERQKSIPAEALESSFSASKKLELPKLPMLEKHDRARLQVQSPNNVYFYWSLKANPFQTLGRTLGNEAASYSLVLRLLDTQTEREEVLPIEAEGSQWFNTDAGRTYRAEIGLYSPSRPFIRILFSNTVTTPRKSPSPRAANQSEWRVTSHKFAEVLDVTGFSRDAFDVAIAGDDAREADDRTYAAFTELLGDARFSRNEVAAEDVRLAMVALAAGRPLEELRWRIGPALFAILQSNMGRFEAGKAAAVMSEHFYIDAPEFEEEEYGPALAASLVHFPKKYATRRAYTPLSSFTLGSR